MESLLICLTTDVRDSSSSSSPRRATSTVLPETPSLPISIVYHSRQVFMATSCIGDLRFGDVPGSWHVFFIAVALSGSGFLPSLSIIWPRYLISSKKNSHFSSLTLKPNLYIRENTLRTCSRCWSLDLLMIIIPSRYAIAKLWPSNRVSITSWKMACTTLIPNGIFSHLNKPLWVFIQSNCELFSSTGIWRYASLRSILQKIFTPFSFVKTSSRLGNGSW